MMNDTSKHEKISALVDGELDDAQLELVLQQLFSDTEKEAWDTYHAIGDVVRSDDLATVVSPDFMQRFSERFASEPVILMPEKHVKVAPEKSSAHGVRSYLKTYLTVATATAAAVFAFVFGPQLSQMGHDQFNPTQISKANSATSQVQLVSASAPSETQVLASANDVASVDQNQANTPEKEAAVEMMRDPRIDSYLIAHQRFSPAISNAAQYVTPATTTTASEK